MIDFELLNCIIVGGEYRYTLPGRGITKKIVYRPIIDVAVEAIAHAATLMVDKYIELQDQIPDAMEQLKKSVDSFLEAHPELKKESEK